MSQTIVRFNPPDVLAYVFAENIHRRQLTAGQRAMIGAKLANLKHGRPEKFVDANFIATTLAADSGFDP